MSCWVLSVSEVKQFHVTNFVALWTYLCKSKFKQFGSKPFLTVLVFRFLN